MTSSNALSESSETLPEQDKRWRNIVGLPVIAFVHLPSPNRDTRPFPAEVTGIEGEYVWVVLDGEEEPRKIHWASVRPR